MAYFLLLVKNVIYGSSVYFTSELSASTDVLDILALRFLMSFVVFYLLKVFKVVKIDLKTNDFLGRTQRSSYIKYLTLAAVFEPVLYMLFETWGITMTTGVTTGVILSLGPIASCITEQAMLKEKATLMQKIFLALGIIGVVYIAINTSSADGKDSPLGILLLILALITGAVYVGFSRKSSAVFKPMEVTYFASFLGAAVFNLINLVRHIYIGDVSNYFSPFFNMHNLIGFVFLAVISTIVATGMNNYAASKLQLSSISAFGGVSTLVTIIIGVVFYGTRLYMYHYIGFFLILVRMVGVSYISIKRDRIKQNKAV